MAEIQSIPQGELRDKIEYELKDRLEGYTEELIQKMLNEVVYTYPDGHPVVTCNPCGEWPAMQFSCMTGEFVGLTPWDYIQEVNIDRQLEEAMR